MPCLEVFTKNKLHFTCCYIFKVEKCQKPSDCLVTAEQTMSPLHNSIANVDFVAGIVLQFPLRFLSICFLFWCFDINMIPPSDRRHCSVGTESAETSYFQISRRLIYGFAAMLFSESFLEWLCSVDSKIQNSNQTQLVIARPPLRGLDNFETTLLL